MKNFLGVLVVGVLAAGAVYAIKKYTEKKQSSSDVENVDLDCDWCADSCRKKADDIFDCALKTIDEMKATSAQFCSDVKGILAAREETPTAYDDENIATDDCVDTDTAAEDED